MSGKHDDRHDDRHDDKHEDKYGGRRCPAGSFPYTIKSGDTLYFLAIRYNTTVEAIMKLNPGIDPNNLQIGQVICIPYSMPRPEPVLPPCPHGVYYRVKPGDTLYFIGQKFCVTVQELLMANPGIDPNNLMVGQILCIPKRCITFCD